jgi:hypothetical protein
MSYHDSGQCPECRGDLLWVKQDTVLIKGHRFTERLQMCIDCAECVGPAAYFPWKPVTITEAHTWMGDTQLAQDGTDTRAEVVERGNRFRFNLCWLLRAEGWTWLDLGEVAWGSDGPCGDAARRRVLRLVNGDVDLKLKDLERFAELLAIPAAVLAYGTAEQVEASWASSRRTK